MTGQKLQIYPGGGTAKLGGLRYQKRSWGQGEQGLLPGLGLPSFMCRLWRADKVQCAGCVFRSKETPDSGIRSSIRHFRLDRRPISTAWACLDSAETPAMRLPQPLILTESSTGWSLALRIKTMMRAATTALRTMEALDGGSTSAQGHCSIAPTATASGTLTLMSRLSMFNPPACWWNSTNRHLAADRFARFQCPV